MNNKVTTWSKKNKKKTLLIFWNYTAKNQTPLLSLSLSPFSNISLLQKVVWPWSKNYLDRSRKHKEIRFCFVVRKKIIRSLLQKKESSLEVYFKSNNIFYFKLFLNFFLINFRGQQQPKKKNDFKAINIFHSFKKQKWNFLIIFSSLNFRKNSMAHEAISPFNMQKHNGVKMKRKQFCYIDPFGPFIQISNCICFQIARI
jgi:hypothetical protein